jgi:hypothetical protein
LEPAAVCSDPVKRFSYWTRPDLLMGIPGLSYRLYRKRF